MNLFGPTTPLPDVIETTWDEFLDIGGKFPDTIREPRIDIEELNTAFDDIRDVDL
jgi:hypothetical protein